MPPRNACGGAHGRRMCLPALFIVLMVLVILLRAGVATAQQGGIGVSNDGPSFTEIEIVEDDNVIYIHVEVRDLNGWSDIFSVNVTVSDNQGRPICQVLFTQYASISSTSLIPTWEQTAGNYLDRTRSVSSPVAVAPWNPVNTDTPIGLRVSFAFQKFSGHSINILAMDKGLLTCEYNGPFSAEYTPAPVFDNVAVPLSLSSVIASVVAVFLVYRRYANNKLARAVEASHTASGEE